LVISSAAADAKVAARSYGEVGHREHSITVLMIG
jgi:hypothetical protein